MINGWRSWIDEPPPSDLLIEVTYGERTTVLYKQDLLWHGSHYFGADCAIGLLWRLTGIGKEQLAGWGEPGVY